MVLQTFTKSSTVITADVMMKSRRFINSINEEYLVVKRQRVE